MNVELASDGVGAETTAVGNIVSAIGQNAPVSLRNDQLVSRQVEASTDVTVTGDAGPYLMTVTSATGNSATAGTCCAPTTGESHQELGSGSVVAAHAASELPGKAGSISVDSTAIGNTTGWNQVNDSVDTWTEQLNGGFATATNSGVFNASPGNIGLSATAVGNNVTGDVENSWVDLGINQVTDGIGVDGVVDAKIASGVDVQGLSTATGNLIDVSVSGGDAAMTASQTFDASLNAYTNLDVGRWSGDASATSSGVGNSVVMSNAGPRTYLGNTQMSRGDITATSSFTGGASGSVFTSAAAMGNAVSGYACSECGGVLDAGNRQTNESRVRAQTNVRITGRAAQVASEALAVGNHASYEVYSNGE